MSGRFRSLRGRNYRTWAGGAIISNIGTWMQRTGQDWLVLTQLSHQHAMSVGIVTALQFAPQFLMLPWSGLAADRLDRRRLLLATQSAMGALALGLGLLTLSGLVQLWHVYVFAFLLGCATAFDAPARQTFVSELVGEVDIANAVALNSASFNAGRLVGPAVAGLLIARIGTGWVFLVNAGSYVAVIASLCRLRTDELQRAGKEAGGRGRLTEGFRYVRARPDLMSVMVMLFLIGTFGLNFAIFISAMSVKIFHAGARQYGLLASSMAIGSVSGALMAAGRQAPDMKLLIGAAALFGFGCGLAAIMPDAWLFGAALVITGIAAQTFTTSSNSLVQLSTEPAMRGRVMAILLATAMGGTPIGAPIAGWLADRCGPRAALGLGVAAGLGAALVGAAYLVRHRRFRLRFSGGRVRFALDDTLIR